MKRVILYLLAFAMSANVYAGFNGVTHHSRANCVNNESISWDGRFQWMFWVNSDHYDARTGTLLCGGTTRWVKDYRAAVVHWGEGTGGWLVHGRHWMPDGAGNPVLVAEEKSTDCSGYDGWWDK